MYQPRDDEYFINNVFEPPFEKRMFVFVDFIENLAQFTGEEANGKFVDMHNLYLEFINLKKIKESYESQVGDYLWYLQHFDQ